jgi:hypothetical protein
MHVLCFENGAEFSLITPVGRSWVVLDSALAVFGDLDWFRLIFDPNPKNRQLAYPRVGFEWRYSVVSRKDLASIATALQPFLDDPIPIEIATKLATRAEQLHVRVLTLSQELRAAAEGLACLAAKALPSEELTLAHTSLL